MSDQRRAADAMPWGLVLAACLILAITFGSTMTRGLFLSPINTTTGLGIVTISFAMAVAQLMWGALQPVFGALADRYGAAAVIVAGGLLLALGNALLPSTTSVFGMVFVIGVMLAAGSAAGSMSVLMGAIGQRIPAAQRSLATGIVNAGGSAGQLMFAPIVAAGIAGVGWMNTIYGWALVALATLPLALAFRRRGPAAHAGPGKSVV